MAQTKVVAKIKTQCHVQYLFSENLAIYEIYGKIWYSPTGHRRQYDTCALYDVYLRLQIHTEYVILIAVPLQQWLLEHTSMLRCSTLPVLFMLCREEGQLEATRRRFSEISP